jgi:hypothetical protein
MLLHDFAFEKFSCGILTKNFSEYTNVQISSNLQILSFVHKSTYDSIRLLFLCFFKVFIKLLIIHINGVQCDILTQAHSKH